MSPDAFEVCIIGAGPRGLSVLERLCANERESPSHQAVAVHLVDPHPPGSGRAWRADQSPLLPANLGPEDYPSRVLYGRYLRDTLRQVLSRVPPHVRVLAHRAQAVELAEAEREGAQTVLLANGNRLEGLDAVVLCMGPVPARAGPGDERIAGEAAAAGLIHVLPADPAEADLTAIAPGEPVLLRGLGLAFFDYLLLLTVARGGRFERSADGGLVYRRSGREPCLYAGSRRGVPYHARGENDKGAPGRHRYRPVLLTAEHITHLRGRAGIGAPATFGDDVWPLVAAEVESVYYAAWLSAAGRNVEAAGFRARYLAAQPGAVRLRLLDQHAVPPRERWDWENLSRPYGRRVFRDRAQFRAWLLGYLARDVRRARTADAGSALNAALDALRDLRGEVRAVADHGGLEGSSYRDEVLGWYAPLDAFLFGGPPASRIEELIALVKAGVIDLVGPRTAVRVESDPTGEPCFTVVSSRVGGPPVRVRALIEARLPEPDVRRTVDPLLSRLIATGQACVYRIDGVDGTSYETGGLAIGRRPYLLLTADGRAHPRRFAYGLPTEAVRWETAADVRPGAGAADVGDCDAVARAVLELAPAAPAPGAGPDARSPAPPAALSDVPLPHRS